MWVSMRTFGSGVGKNIAVLSVLVEEFSSNVDLAGYRSEKNSKSAKPACDGFSANGKAPCARTLGDRRGSMLVRRVLHVCPSGGTGRCGHGSS